MNSSQLYVAVTFLIFILFIVPFYFNIVEFINLVCKNLLPQDFKEAFLYCLKFFVFTLVSMSLTH